MLTCKELITALIKTGHKTNYFKRNVALAIYGDDNDNDCEDLSVSRVPDAYRIDQDNKEITWIEIDKNHQTDEDKLRDLYFFADELIGEGWSFNVSIYVVHPLAVLVYEIRDMASPIEKEIVRKHMLSDHIKGRMKSKQVDHSTPEQLKKMMNRVRMT